MGLRAAMVDLILITHYRTRFPRTVDIPGSPVRLDANAAGQRAENLIPSPTPPTPGSRSHVGSGWVPSVTCGPLAVTRHDARGGTVGVQPRLHSIQARHGRQARRSTSATKHVQGRSSPPSHTGNAEHHADLFVMSTERCSCPHGAFDALPDSGEHVTRPNRAVPARQAERPKSRIEARPRGSPCTLKRVTMSAASRLMPKARVI